MSEVTLTPYEFIITLDNDPAEIFNGVPVGLQIKNPHGVTMYDVPTLSMIKLLANKINNLKPRKKMPSDEEIEKKVRDLMLNTKTEQKLSFYMEIYRSAWNDSQ